MNKLTDKLLGDLLNNLGYDSDKMIEIYYDFGRSRFAFERHFVVEEQFEASLMNEVKEQFTLYNTVINELRARGQ